MKMDIHISFPVKKLKIKTTIDTRTPVQFVGCEVWTIGLIYIPIFCFTSRYADRRECHQFNRRKFITLSVHLRWQHVWRDAQRPCVSQFLCNSWGFSHHSSLSFGLLIIYPSFYMHKTFRIIRPMKNGLALPFAVIDINLIDNSCPLALSLHTFPLAIQRL